MNRSRMRRQLYSGGGITSVPRVGFGLGSSIKKRLRKLIPNELADIAVKAAPFVAPFNPGIAGLMRGIGRFDQRGSMSDALKQGLLTYGGGQLARHLGGAGVQKDFLGTSGDRFTTPLSQDRMEGVRNLFRGRGESTGNVTGKVANVTGQDPSGLGYGEFLGTAPTSSDPYSLKGIWDKWTGLNPQLRTAIVGVGSGAIAGFAQWVENQIPQEPGESMDEYLARRKVAVGDLMLQYLDNTRAFDAEWTAKTLEQKKEEIANLNYNQGGRVGYQTGGISMGNTLAQNIAANQAQAARVNQMLQAARAKLPSAGASGLTSLTQSFQPQTRSQARTQLFGGPPSGGTTTTTSKPVLQTGTQTPRPPSTLMSPPLAPPDPFKPYGVTPDQYAKMSPEDQDKLWRKIDYVDQYGGELGTTAKILEERGVDPKQFITGTSPSGSPMYNRQRLMEALLRSDIGELYGDWQGHGKTITGQETFDELLDLEDYWKQFRYNQGGRVGLAFGTPEEGIDRLQTDAPDITYEGNEGPKAPMKMADMEQIAIDFKRENGWDMSLASPEMIKEYIKEWKARQLETSGGQPLPEDPTKPVNPWTPKPQGPVLPNKMMAAQGGRIGAYGGGVMGIGTPGMGLPGIPRMAPDGMEYDMSQNGGFQPLGAREGKDDIKANLAKNEFVFTADAVRGAGNGDIELGAQKMYDTMKKLERRVG